jgi:hypothetical protein
MKKLKKLLFCYLAAITCLFTIGISQSFAQLGTELLVPAVAKEIVAPSAQEEQIQEILPEEFQFLPPGEFPPPLGAKTFGFALETMGAVGMENQSALGPAGVKMFFNVGNKLAAIIGFGGWNTSTTLNNVSISGVTLDSLFTSQLNYLFMLRFGGKVYGSFGMSVRTNTEKVTAGSYSVEGMVMTSGFPLMVGIETGRKRGLFFFFEVGYAIYMSGDTVVKTDGPLNLNVESPTKTGPIFSAGIGRYIK